MSTQSAAVEAESGRTSDAAGVITISHRRAGELRVAEKDALRFEGIPGFPEARRWALLAHDTPSLYSWLVSLDDATLALPVLDPRPAFPGYAPKLSRGVLEALGDPVPETVVVLAIANLSKQPPVVNLAAPLLVNPENRRGLQAILEEDQPVAAQLPDDAGCGVPTPQIESNPQR